jgi:hypothetical protein
MLAGLDKPPRLTGAAKTAKAKLGEEISLQSLIMMSHASTRSTRGAEATLVESIGAP